MAFLRDIEKLIRQPVPMTLPNGTVAERTVDPAPRSGASRAADAAVADSVPARRRGAQRNDNGKRPRNRGKRNGNGGGQRRDESQRNQPSARSRPEQGIAGLGFMNQKPRRPGMQQGSASAPALGCGTRSRR